MGRKRVYKIRDGLCATITGQLDPNSTKISGPFPAGRGARGGRAMKTLPFTPFQTFPYSSSRYPGCPTRLLRVGTPTAQGQAHRGPCCREGPCCAPPDCPSHRSRLQTPFPCLCTPLNCECPGGCNKSHETQRLQPCSKHPS